MTPSSDSLLKNCQNGIEKKYRKNLGKTRGLEETEWWNRNA